MLDDGTVAAVHRPLSVTGLTSNPSIFDKAISGGDAYDAQIAEISAGSIPEERIGATPTERIFFELAIDDLRDATALFHGVHERTDGLDGWCSLEVSPLIADDTEKTIEEAANCAPRRSATTSSSRSRAPRRVLRRSRSRSSPASR